MKRNKQRHGFTLLEILVAMTIITAVICMVYGSYFVLSASTERFQTRINTDRQSRTLLEGLSRQIRCSYIPSDITEAKKDNKNIYIDRDKSLFYCDTQDSTGNILSFVTTAHLVDKKSPNTGLYDISYRYDKTKHTISLSQRNFINKINTSNKSPRKYLPIAENIESVKLKFYDGNQWFDKWDLNKKKHLPAAAEIELTCSDENGGYYYYKNTISLYCGNKVNKKQETVLASKFKL